MLNNKRNYNSRVKLEESNKVLTLIQLKLARLQSLSIMSNRSIASITEKLGFASLKQAISLNNANIIIIDPIY